MFFSFPDLFICTEDEEEVTLMLAQHEVSIQHILITASTNLYMRCLFRYFFPELSELLE